MPQTSATECTSLDEIETITRVRLRTGGLIIADAPVGAPEGFLLINHHLPEVPPVFLPARYAEDVVTFFKRHNCLLRKPETILPDSRYAVGRIEQQCPKCKWLSSYSHMDFGICQACGASMAVADSSITFFDDESNGDGRVLTVELWYKGFAFGYEGTDDDARVRVWNADLPEVIECLTPAKPVVKAARRSSMSVTTALCLGTIAMLVFALFPMPYGYYRCLRWVVLGTAGFLLLQWCRLASRETWGVPVGLLLAAIIFNPLVPLELSRPTWTFLDVIAGLVYLTVWAHFEDHRDQADKS